VTSTESSKTIKIIYTVTDNKLNYKDLKIVKMKNYTQILSDIQDQIGDPRHISLSDELLGVAPDESCITFMVLDTFIDDLEACAEGNDLLESTVAKEYIQMYKSLEPLSQYCPGMSSRTRT
jgi:hypothetical protein